MKKYPDAILKYAFLHATGTLLYVAGIASFLFYAPRFLGPRQAHSVLGPIVLLALFVFSAALTGILVFGRPVMWYLDGKKKDAISLLACTLGIFFVMTAAGLILLFVLA